MQDCHSASIWVGSEHAALHYLQAVNEERLATAVCSLVADRNKRGVLMGPAGAWSAGEVGLNTGPEAGGKPAGLLGGA